jgi:hypothetical protein
MHIIMYTWCFTFNRLQPCWWIVRSNSGARGRFGRRTRACLEPVAENIPFRAGRMLVARWLARFMVSSAWLGLTRLNFFTSWADMLGRFVNEPARELNELPHSSKTKLYAYYLQNYWWTCYIYVRCLWPMS